MYKNVGVVDNKDTQVTDNTRRNYPQVHLTYAGALQTQVTRMANRILIVSEYWLCLSPDWAHSSYQAHSSYVPQLRALLLGL